MVALGAKTPPLCSWICLLTHLDLSQGLLKSGCGTKVDMAIYTTELIRLSKSGPYDTADPCLFSLLN